MNLNRYYAQVKIINFLELMAELSIVSAWDVAAVSSRSLNRAIDDMV